MKKILVPIDFSENSKNALAYAIDFCKGSNSKIYLLHSYDIPFSNAYTSYELYSEEIDAAKKESDKQIKQLANKMRKNASVKFHTLSSHELVEDAIIKACRKESIDLIIMGTKGETNAPDILIGSVASAIIEKATCPVFTIPESCKFKQPKHIAVATNYGANDLLLLNKVSSLFSSFESAVSLVHIADKKETDHEQRMERLMQEARKKAKLNSISHYVLPPGDVKEQLEIFIKEMDVDVLAVSPKNHSFFERIFNPSISRKMSYHSHIPLLSFHG